MVMFLKQMRNGQFRFDRMDSNTRASRMKTLFDKDLAEERKPAFQQL
jgi:hypothetical protein